jgi:hypothetical protein
MLPDVNTLISLLIFFSLFDDRIVILPRIFRIINLIRTIRILRHREHFKTGSRHLVGQNKKRTIGDGFDLDLCSISGKFVSVFLFKHTKQHDMHHV